METQDQSRPPFKISGVATIKRLNVRKEGPEDEKILAVDVKLEFSKVDRRLCAYFDDALEAFLWRGDTDALIAELSKEPCAPDPESPAAIRNGKFAGLASIAAQGLGMVRGPSLTEHLVEAKKDAERLDWIIEHRAYVVSDPDCCDGYWLNYARPDGTMWTQATEHETPRAAIDAAKGEPS